MDVTVPIKDQDKVIGVLVGVITQKQFSRWFEKVNIENGTVLVFNQRGQALKHGVNNQDDVQEMVELAGDDNPPGYAKELAKGLKPIPKENECQSFDDPFQKGRQDSGGVRLAGYKFFNPNDKEPDGDGPLGKQWAVVVEHQKDKALEPVENLRLFMVRDGLLLLIMAGALTGAVWLGLIWLLRREERLGHG
jgi:hypothetical protein